MSVKKHKKKPLSIINRTNEVYMLIVMILLMTY
ncbi:Uncharacterised protein [Anaerobiospirillum thomasii]|uniref:Uncharacterized protein n=1 Tax=Anaerobiospirillum thomasii TaxID=179995 RepID=A0A2X0V7J4_9GAMM|nr:Uncharacterised protein [Anaerobiospirillum thomasii]SPT70329.1 Uncharacterised protein [Anaerobiospirillum thomasii]